MSRLDHYPPRLRLLPIAAWPSLLSLDAVFVALAWQQLLLWSFCRRTASWLEISSLAAAVWLIYVADRLLDAARLQLNQPHTLRHRFYRRYSRLFLLLWFVVLIAVTIAVVRYLPGDLLWGGLWLASAVLVYGAHLHFAAKIPSDCAPTQVKVASKFAVPKEIRVGTLFACGVALTTWTQLTANSPIAASHTTQMSSLVTVVAGPLGTLAATTVALALLFSCNCMLVARFEFEVDRAQSFESIATRWAQGRVGCWPLRAKLQPANVAMPCMSVLLLLLIQLPSLILIAIAISALGLGVSMTLQSTSNHLLPTPNTQTAFDIRSVWVDAALWTPPVVLLNLL